MTLKIDNSRLCKLQEAKRRSVSTTTLEHSYLVNRIKCLEIKIHDTSKEVVRLQTEGSSYAAELKSRWALDADIMRKLQSARRTAGALNASLAREAAGALQIESLKNQNASLQSEAANVGALKNDLDFARGILHKAYLDYPSSAVGEMCKSKVIGRQAAGLSDFNGGSLNLTKINGISTSTGQLTNKVSVLNKQVSTI